MADSVKRQELHNKATAKDVIQFLSDVPEHAVITLNTRWSDNIAREITVIRAVWTDSWKVLSQPERL